MMTAPRCVYFAMRPLHTYIRCWSRKMANVCILLRSVNRVAAAWFAVPLRANTDIAFACTLRHQTTASRPVSPKRSASSPTKMGCSQSTSPSKWLCTKRQSDAQSCIQRTRSTRYMCGSAPFCPPQCAHVCTHAWCMFAAASLGCPHVAVLVPHLRHRCCTSCLPPQMYAHGILAVTKQQRLRLVPLFHFIRAGGFQF